MFRFGARSVRKTDAVPVTAAVASPSAPPEPAATIVGSGSGSREVVELLEADLKRAAARMDAVGRDTRVRVEESTGILDGLRHETDELAEQTDTALRNINSLADGFHELHQTAEEIGRRAQTSQRLVDEASDVAKVAARSVEELKAAIEQIQAVVSLISDVAGQTNLLALNATIEAARAGAAGRGFAVVASEVKALSVETQKATSEIGATIGRLKTTAEANIAAVDKILGLVGEIGPVFGEVSQSVQMQIGTTAEIGRSAGETARFADSVAVRAREMSAGMARAAEIGRAVETATQTMNTTVGEMNRQLVTVLRQSPDADRRRHDRWPVELHGETRIGGTRVVVRTLDLSLGGALIVPQGETGIAAGTRLDLELTGLGAVRAVVVGKSTLGLHVKFDETDAGAADRIRARIAAIEADYRPLIEIARSGGLRAVEAIERAVETGALTRSDLFDTTYRPIANTSPLQYETRALAALERILPPILESVLGSDSRMTFCACVDINGWLPVHNKVYSHPQRPGDTVWNTANSRNKRIYDDRTGLLAARNTRPFLIQSYLRDLGNGNIVVMKEVDVPVVLGGRHWGGFRTGYRM